jgi:hypothetical protein
MGTVDLKTVIVQVLSSWQVLAVTIAVLVYWGIVYMATHPSKKPPKSKTAKPEKIKRPSEPAADLGKNVDDSDVALED